jgi:hypothetical protein
MNWRGRWVFPALLLIAISFAIYVFHSTAADWGTILLIAGLSVVNTPPFQKFWKALSLQWKVSLIFLASILFLFVAFIVNLHEQSAAIYDLACAGFLLSLLLLWGLYSLMSRGLDALWIFIKEHR